MKTIRIRIRTQDFKPKGRERYYLNLLKVYSEDGYYRKGNFSTELIWDRKTYVFPNKNHRSYRKGFFLFKMVRRDAQKFLDSGKSVRVPTRYPVNDYNDNFDKFDLPVTGTDLNHAYWRIAYNLGIISKKTYESGLDEEYKVVRLASLSTLGKGKDYYVIRDGKMTKEMVNIGRNEVFEDLYKAIRYTCYKYMQKIKKLLKNDFVCYKTDCVYYVDTPENRKKVRDYFEKESMSMKQLTNRKKPHTSEVFLHNQMNRET